jgi:vacuolar-type H+-ATPase subunit I/STV1
MQVDKMNSKELTDLIHDVSLAEIQYYKAKENREHNEDEKNLTIKWDTVNDYRSREDLPPIKNETQRKSYIRTLIEDYKHEENCKLVELNNLKMLYENRETLNYKKCDENEDK